MDTNQLSTAASETSPHKQSYEEIKAWVTKKIAEVLEVEINCVDPDQNFSSFGIDSIVALAITGELVEWINKEMPATLLWEYTTINSLSKHISEQLGNVECNEQSFSNAILLAGNEGRKDLFCICGIGLYQHLADSLRKTMNTYGIFVPPEKVLGKFGKELDDRYEYQTVEALAKCYVEEIIAIKPQGPYYLLGLSFGGILAFETAQQLKRSGADVPVIILLDSVLPSAVKVKAYRHVINLIKNSISEFYGNKNMPKDQIHKLSSEEMKEYRGQYYWTLSQSYEPLSYAGSVILVRALGSKLFGTGIINDEQLGWKDLVIGEFETLRLEGTHTGILQQPYVSEIATALCAKTD